ncbi:MAG: DUF2239 family protein [Alkalispirochaeta sp.]
MDEHTYFAFAGDKRIASGELETVLTDLHSFVNRNNGNDTPSFLVFRADTGRQVDFDLTGTLDEVLARALPEKPKKGPGRPRIGVHCGEVCLLPRHWEWLERQPKKASVTLRLLVEQAMKNMTPEERARERVEAAHTFMWAVAGDKPGFEEASRALYAGKREVFDALIAPWPEDIVAQIRRFL